MSLDGIMRRRKKSVSPPEPETASGGQPGKDTPVQKLPDRQVEPNNNAAMIPAERVEALEAVVKVLGGDRNQGMKGFSMNELLKMDDSQKGLPDILGYPIGAQENDMYRMLERCRLTKHEKQVYVHAIHFAEHGLGYHYKQPNSPGDGINLDFPVPFYGEYIVKQLRGSVSVDGESLATFERTTATWVAKLYASQQQAGLQQQRGIIQ